MKDLFISLKNFLVDRKSTLLTIVVSTALAGLLFWMFFLDIKTVDFFLINMLYAIAAVYCLFVALRIRDLRLKINFKNDVWPTLITNPIAVAIWLAAWVIAGGMVIAAALSG